MFQENNPEDKSVVNLEVRKNGPLRVIAKQIILTHSDGTEEIKEDITSICRCGLSQKMPFCDGAHKGKPFE
jgi:CDGSH iron-sulfur domain-containing protein 3